MKALLFQKTHLLSFFIFFVFFLTTNNASAACSPPNSIHPPDYGLPGGGCHIRSVAAGDASCSPPNSIHPPDYGLPGGGCHAKKAVAGFNQPFNDAINDAARDATASSPDCDSELDPNFEGPPRPRCQEQREQEEQQEKINACQSASNSAWQFACDASQFSPVIMGALQAFKSPEASGDIQAICQKNKELTKWALTFNTATLAACLFALKKCTGTCGAAAQFDPNSKYLADECASKRKWTLLIGGPAVIYGLAQAINSADCPDAPTTATGRCGEVSQRRQDCLANSAANGSSCAQENREYTECIAGGQQEGPCAGLTGSDLLECLGVDPTTPTPGRELPDPIAIPRRTGGDKTLSTANFSDPTFDPDDHLDENEGDITPTPFTGNDRQVNSVPLASTSGGGGGGLGGAPGGGFGGGPDGEGEEGDEGPYEENVDPGIDTNILGDVSNSRGGSSGFGGSGYGKNKGTGLRKNPKGFAFPKNLFGNKKTNKAGRSLAGIAGSDEVTSANGLSNFQKVSRAMNDRRQNVFK